MRRLLSSAPSTHTSIKGVKRFYAKCDVERLGERSFQVTLDGRALKTPSKKDLGLTSPALAWAIAAEWDNQTSRFGIEPAFMPLTSLVATAVDQIEVDKAGTVDTLVPFLRTDTTCFVAPSKERILRKRQLDTFLPLHEWVEATFGATLSISEDIVSSERQDDAVVMRIRESLMAMDALQLAALQIGVRTCKSMVLGLALVHQQVRPQEAMDASRIEEDFQMEQWGLVEGGHDVDRANCIAALSSADALLRLKDL